MNNAQIAVILDEIALCLELKNETIFRIRAFKRAAEAVAGHHETLADLASAAAFQKIDGVGKSIAADMEALLTTGKSPTREALRQEVPDSLLALGQIQGLGPKRIRTIWQQLGVDTLADLRDAAQKGQISGLKGLGKKVEANILKELDRIDRLAGRTVIGQAWPLAHAIERHLAAVPGVERVQICGSLRRWRETVGDLDFVAAVTGDPMTVMNALIAYESVEDVIAHGASKTSVRLHGGLQVDLRAVEPDVFGSAIHHFTGSQFHHIELRKRAKKRGLKVSEYGVFRVSDDTRVAAATEADVYAALDLAFVPPELRENRGEVEAADNGTLPRLIEMGDIRGDLHMHTTETDGAASIEEMAIAARERGYSYIVITDHSQAVSVANGMTPTRCLAHLERIREVDARTEGIRVLAGIEVDILKDGSLDMPDEVLERLDFVVASVHSYFNQEPEAITARMLRAVRSGQVHAIGHPTGRILGGRDPYAVDVGALIEAAAQSGVALEINAAPSRLDLSDAHCKLAKEAGCTLIISSDAHSTQGLDVMAFGVATARRGWLEPTDVLNTLPLEDFLERIDLGA